MDEHVGSSIPWRLWLLLVPLALLLPAACQPSAVPSPTALPPGSPTATAVPLSSPVAIAPPTTSAGPVAPADLAIGASDIAVYPGPPNYVGDDLSFDVTPRNVGSIAPSEIAVRIYRESIDPANVVAAGTAGYPTFDQMPRIRMSWAWETAGLVGEQTLIAWLDPDDAVQEGDEDPANNLVTFTVDLRPAAEMPLPEAASAWMTTDTACCALHYLLGTSADRDMPTITVVANEAVAEVQAQLGVTLSDPLDIYFVGRVIGHGGYAYESVALSYLDRHYAGFDLAVVIRHEATHVLDGKLLQGGKYPPAILREGLATWVGRGHFKPEPIPQRAAALLQVGRYIPLEPLADDFYRQQHEIGYLEGAAFVAYLVDRYGWEAFCDFYRSFPTSSDATSVVLGAVLQDEFGLGLPETEAGFRAWLESHPPTPDQVRDLVDTVDLFDTVRRYQATWDTAAYWMSGWLPNPTAGQQRDIVADFLRHPRRPENIALEAMLIAAREDMRRGRYDRTEELIAAVNRVLDRGGFGGDPESDYLAVVQALAAAGYEAQQIDLDGDTAQAAAIAEWPALRRLALRRTPSGWVLAGSAP